MQQTLRQASVLLCLALTAVVAASQTQRVLSSLRRSTDLEALHRNLTNIESVSGHENEIGKWLEYWLKEQGYSVHLQHVDSDRYNVLAWPGSHYNTHTLVTSHIDTVPPYFPYKATRNDSTLLISGRGSVDAKAAVASQIVAVNELLNDGEIDVNDIALLFVVGEEVGGAGMKAANKLNLTPEVVIFGEPTEGKLVAGHKGIDVFRVEARGQAAHSGYPWLGRNANDVLIEVLAAIKQVERELPSSDKYGSTTINIGKMGGGQAGNVVAEYAEADLTARIATGTPAELRIMVLKAVDEVVQRYRSDPEDEIVKVVFQIEGYGPVGLDHDVPGFEVMTVNYGTDVPNLDKTVEGQKRYLFGGGSIFVAHSDHEGMTWEDLVGAVDGYKRLIKHTCLE